MSRYRLTLFVVLSALAVSAQETSPVYVFSTLAGQAGSSGSRDGVGAEARFTQAYGIAVDDEGVVYVAEATNHTVRKITPDGRVTTLAGVAGVVGTTDGTGAAALFGSSSSTSTPAVPTGPMGVAVDKLGNIYVADSGNHTIRRITPGGVVTTLAGSANNRGSSDGPAAAGVVRFNQPLSVAVDNAGIVYVADCFNHTIRAITPAGAVSTIAGSPGVPGSTDGVGARFFFPDAMAVDAAGNVYVTDANFLVRRLLKPATGTSEVWTTSTLAGGAREYGAADGVGVAARFGGMLNPGTISWLFSRSTSDPPGVMNGESITVGSMAGMAVDKAGNVLVADTLNHTIRRITPAGIVTTVAGAPGESGRADGIGSAARFFRPKGIALDKFGNLYVVDSISATIRKGVLAIPPSIAAAPGNRTAVAGGTVMIQMQIGGNPPPTFQWSKNGVPILGATNGVLTLANVQPADDGAYAVMATNAFGSVTSAGVMLTVNVPPVISLQPVSRSVLGGQPVTLSVTASGTPVPAVQWLRNGSAIPGATGTNLLLPSAQAGDAGSYTAALTNAAGAVISSPAIVSVDTSRIVNLSVRSNLTSGGGLTIGFVVGGERKPLLVRGVGPALRAFGLEGALADPRLKVFSGSVLVASNDNWGGAVNAADVATTAAQVGAFALPTGSLDAAIFTTIDHGGYSVQIEGTSNTGGVVLVEVYDASPTSAARLVNVSARAQVGVGESGLFTGFVLTGNARRSVLVRAIGPSLALFGVDGVLADPRLELRGGGVSLAVNDDWGGGTGLAAAFASVGAFPLAAGSKDSALLVTLDPGSYTAQVTGVAGAIGEALVEIYELP